jgi:hypothetical protein
MSQVTSKDGTSIAYDRQGHGPAVILVGDRSENAPLAMELAESFTVYNYDQRGRADSGDTLPYAVEREIEDLEALITVAGGTADVEQVKRTWSTQRRSPPCSRGSSTTDDLDDGR